MGKALGAVREVQEEGEGRVEEDGESWRLEEEGAVLVYRGCH